MKTAPELLAISAHLLTERGKQYDKPEGERSMEKTIEAFNAITGRALREDEGWLLMLLLKQVRLYTNPTTVHHDSIHDGIAYCALEGEAWLRRE